MNRPSSRTGWRPLRPARRRNPLRRNGRVERLEPRRVLAGWVAVLPTDMVPAAVAQFESQGPVAVAYERAEGTGTLEVRKHGAEPPGFTDFPHQRLSPSGSDHPPQLLDSVFTELGQRWDVGGDRTEEAAAEGIGAPVAWSDGVPAAVGLDDTQGGNNGAVYAITSDGLMVGEDDLLPIVRRAGQTLPLPLPDDRVTGAARDTNGPVVVGFDSFDALCWVHTDQGWQPRSLEHPAGDFSGVAASVSDYGLMGGWYERPVGQSSRRVGMIWNADGTLRREFREGASAEVSQVVDFLASVHVDGEARLYLFGSDRLVSFDEFLTARSLNLEGTVTRILDMEWATDRSGLNLLLEVHDDADQLSHAVVHLERRDVFDSWQHPLDRFDVNNDGFRSPRDALVVINSLNSTGSREFGPEEPAPDPFWDVSGDGRISPVDALQVINELNTR